MQLFEHPGFEAFASVLVLLRDEIVQGQSMLLGPQMILDLGLVGAELVYQNMVLDDSLQRGHHVLRVLGIQPH